jgi:hypothetical protein
MDIFKLGANTDSEESAFQLATTLGLVYTYTRTCPKCYTYMDFKWGKFRHGVDAHFVCVKRACSYSMSIYTDTILKKGNFQYQKFTNNLLLGDKIWCTKITSPL